MRMLRVRLHGSKEYQPIVCRTDFVTKLCRILQESGWIIDVVDSDIVVDIPVIATGSAWMFHSGPAKISKDSWELLHSRITHQVEGQYVLHFLPNHRVVFSSNERSVRVGIFNFIHNGDGELTILVEVNK